MQCCSALLKAQKQVILLGIRIEKSLNWGSFFIVYDRSLNEKVEQHASSTLLLRADFYPFHSSFLHYNQEEHFSSRESCNELVIKANKRNLLKALLLHCNNYAFRVQLH